MKNLKQKEGITLIALIITIIVLLILAGVTISMITGDSGILKNAQKAVTKTELAQLQESIQLYYASNILEDTEEAPVDKNVKKGELKDELTETIVAQEQGVELIENINYDDLYYLSEKKLGMKLDNKRFFMDITTQKIFINGGANLGEQTIYMLEELTKQEKTNILAQNSKIYAGSNNTYVVKGNGDMYAIGESNSYNPLGLTFTDKYDINYIPQKTDIKIIPEEEATDNDFVEVYGSTIEGYYLFKKKNGDVYAAGNNSYGQLGVGDNEYKTALTKVQIDSVKEIQVVVNTVYYLKEDGTVWGTGQNKYTRTNVTYPAVIGEDSYYVQPVQITYKENGEEVFSNVKHIYSDRQSNTALGVIVLKENGEIWVSDGYDGRGRYGESKKMAHPPLRLTKVEELVSTNNSNIKDIKAGYTMFVLLENGTLYAAGENWNGELANGTAQNVGRAYFSQIILPENISKIYYNYGNSIAAITNTNNLYIWGYNAASDFITTPLLIANNILKTAEYTSIDKWFLTIDGKLYKYTKDDNEQLIENNIKIIEGNKAGFIDEDNYFWTWGGILLKDKGKKIILTKTNLNNVKEFFTGNVPSMGKGCAVLTNNNEIYAWGNNASKNIVNNSERIIQNPLKVPISAEINGIKEFKHNTSNSYIIDQSNNLWSRGSYSATGITATEPIPEYTKVTEITNIKEVYINLSAIFVLKTDNTLWVRGYSDGNNHLGIDVGAGTYMTTFKQIEKDSSGNSIDFSNLKTITETGYRHVVALMNDGTIYVWGNNMLGQLGIGNTTNMTYPTKLSNFPSKVVDVKAMNNNIVFLLENGDVYVSGDNSYGQLGIGNRTSSNVPVKANISNVKEIVTGLNHIIAIKEDNSVWAWGAGTYGQLGTRKTQDELTPVQAYELCE